MTNKVMVMVAPNGARRTKVDHPNIPLTTEEVVTDVLASRENGAYAVHVHARDDELKHTLDATRYGDVLTSVGKAVGDSMVIQMTTEAVGVYSAAEQMAAVKALRPTFVSLAISEFVRDGDHEQAAFEFFAWLKENAIVPQFILYVPEDLTLFLDLKARGLIPFENPYLLFVLGRYSVNQQSSPADLQPFMDVFGKRTWPFMVCAFGAQEAACMRAAMDAGGHARVGFENNLLMPDGTQAPSNAALVKNTVDEVEASGREVMNADEIRAFLATCLV